MEEKKALIAMSGGVDSSVAAYLTQQAGYTCIGANLCLYKHKCDSQEDGCGMSRDAEDAKQVAENLGMPFYVFDCSERFNEKVIGYFIHCYETGTTPNPCIQCNRYLKFDELLQRALEMGCDKVVSGHYAQIRRDEETGRYLLFKAKDLSKDQSYVLYTLTQEQLSHILFPLGSMTKAEARVVAEQQGFLTARKHDSQDICFIPDGDYVSFMERFTGKQYEPGNFLNLQGDVVGQHRGAVCYTLGQRKGLGLAMGAPVYVCDKNMENNTVTVGPNESLYATTLLANNWNWLPFSELTEPLQVSAKARYNQQPQPATVYPEENGMARVVFDAPQRALTPGQAVVLYHDDMVVGGGTIVEIIKE